MISIKVPKSTPFTDLLLETSLIIIFNSSSERRICAKHVIRNNYLTSSTANNAILDTKESNGKQEQWSEPT